MLAVSIVNLVLQEEDQARHEADLMATDVAKGVTKTVHGYTYSNWGVNYCGGAAELLYSGTTTLSTIKKGKHYFVAQLCLPDESKLSVENKLKESLSMRIYEGINQQCAVCNYSGKHAEELIPCPSGSTNKNSGYFKIGNSGGQYVCIERDQNSHQAGQARLQDKQLEYRVKAAWLTLESDPDLCCKL